MTTNAKIEARIEAEVVELPNRLFIYYDRIGYFRDIAMRRSGPYAPHPSVDTGEASPSPNKKGWTYCNINEKGVVSQGPWFDSPAKAESQARYWFGDWRLAVLTMIDGKKHQPVFEVVQGFPPRWAMEKMFERQLQNVLADDKRVIAHLLDRAEKLEEHFAKAKRRPEQGGLMGRMPPQEVEAEEHITKKTAKRLRKAADALAEYRKPRTYFTG